MKNRSYYDQKALVVVFKQPTDSEIVGELKELICTMTNATPTWRSSAQKVVECLANIFQPAPSTS